MNQRVEAAIIHISIMSDRRQKFLDKFEESWDEEELDYKMKMPKEIDELEDSIKKEIRENVSELPIDFILEELTKLGDAPNLVYDDNGHFAVSGDSFSNVAETGQNNDSVITTAISHSSWKNTIREAVEYYIKEQ